MALTVDGDAGDDVHVGSAEELSAAAQQRRRVLWERHARARSGELGNGLDEVGLQELFALTDEVLDLERRASERRAADSHRHSSRWVYALASALVAVSVIALTLGLVFHWLSGWGIAASVTSIVVGFALAGVHMIALADGHRERVQAAVVALVLGVTLDALAPAQLSGWISVFLLVLLLGAVGWLIASVHVELAGRER